MYSEIDNFYSEIFLNELLKKRTLPKTVVVFLQKNVRRE